MSAMASAIVIGAGLTYMASQSQADAAKDAANAQSQAAGKGIAEQRRQFDALQKLFAPYIQGGTGAFGAQGDLVGLNGPEAQQKALAALQSGPQFQALTQQGENAILSNASATGGLRGGNVQAALAQFRPQVLSQLIDSQFNKLGSMAQLGQASAAGQASAGLQTGTNISNLLGQQGAAIAGGALAAGNAQAQQYQATGNTFSNLMMAKAMGMF